MDWNGDGVITVDDLAAGDGSVADPFRASGYDSRG
jgi:hypothetical protein